MCTNSFSRSHQRLFSALWIAAASAALRGVQPIDSVGLAAALRVQNQAGRWQAALELFRAAKDKKCIPDRSSYTEAIVAHGRLKQSDQALDVFRAMQDAGLPPNVVSCALPLTLTSEREARSRHAPSRAQTRPRSPRAGARATGRSRSRYSQTCKRTA